MSSIYKKGRDGYYYYQTYVYNPETKKKDKRIFYALRTRDLHTAKTKQIELDLQHDNQNFIKPDTLLSFFKLRPKQNIAIIVGSIFTVILLINYYKSNNVKQDFNGSSLTGKIINIEKRNDSLPKTIGPIRSDINQQTESKIKKNKEVIKTNPRVQVSDAEVIIPKYSIERVETLSGVFEQGKIYVTINKNSSNDSQRLLCEDLTKRYSEFSNIVICLYANNRAGKDLARGNDETVSVEEQKRSWLAMYTYNSVEGEYFDDNPSGYLGIY